MVLRINHFVTYSTDELRGIANRNYCGFTKEIRGNEVHHPHGKPAWPKTKTRVNRVRLDAIVVDTINLAYPNKALVFRARDALSTFSDGGEVYDIRGRLHVELLAC